MNFNHEEYLKHLSLDCVIFGFHENQLKVLLLKLKHSKKLALPGGFVKTEESMESAAIRVLQERTGLDNVFMNQFGVFSEPVRSANTPVIEDLSKSGVNNDLEWFNQRFISVGFYALVESNRVNPAPDFFSESCDWFEIHNEMDLILDHSQIIHEALKALRIEINHQPIGRELLPEKFTMPELQKVYETILDKQLDRRNFQRKMLSFNILNRHDKKKTGGAHKAPYLYSFNDINYEQALKEGYSGGW